MKTERFTHSHEVSQNEKCLSPRVAHNSVQKLHMEKHTVSRYKQVKKKKKPFLQYTAVTADNQGETFTAPDSTSEEMNHCCV